ncbi:LemA family protein [Candidatus Woesearchaeota archaeon]|nr:LemA family protein [Candidatus Woesearchaeota archaeon]MCF7901411.1 LemA family protein [Candidatus Woesearchaeota archaeon]MCF8012976.1 LemA family protein [Candidatus Woesearchaeota archaeon]
MWEWIILAIVVLIVLIVWGLYNALVRLKNQVKNSWSQIDVQLKRRNDLIPNLIETVKGYAKHEKGTFEKVTEARSVMMKAGSVESKAEASNMLSDTLKSLFAVAENYPDLKANQNFLQLQEELAGTENKIAYSRQHYNDMVMVFNTKIELFPNNVFANMLNFKQEEYFKTPEAEKKVPKVSF